MATDDRPVAPARADDVDLYTIGADVPDGEAVLLVTEIDSPDGVFVGQWSDEETVSRIFDGDVYIRLRRAQADTVDAHLILAHDGQLLPIMRVQEVADWAEQLRPAAAAIMSLHADLESGGRCKAYVDIAVAPD
ncbi:hypothetical protein [Catenulispora pinisilvae]|uniref:hypothetical protein n=1 Tax=Catenulispora pinisilvae TaxID=2705253 RepID=UPI001891FC56|nr:hypothetical protein [Catenulispora pinisilvae]